MSEITDILGKTDVQERILVGLSRLEYCGYDSAGVAVMSEAKVSVAKSVGKLVNLKAELVRKPLPAPKLVLRPQKLSRVNCSHFWGSH
jgi:glucosamine--fructose-6-phosphate aminotransferase (isomerizing)